MIRMLVGPPLPITERHRAKEPVDGFDRLRTRRGEPPGSLEHTLQIRGELRRTSACDTRVMRGIRLPSVRPADGRPQAEPLHDRSVTPGDWTIPWSNPENHLRGVAEVTGHLVRGERTPAALARRTERGEAFGQ